VSDCEELVGFYLEGVSFEMSLKFCWNTKPHLEGIIISVVSLN
ncbi:uncharacterized protein METZ01_LOCUS492711, partial [marine metagenome]